MIPRTEIEEIVRQQASEDWYGLYEVIWALNTRYPSIPEDSKIRSAAPVLRQLVERGELQLFRSTWAGSDYVAIPANEALDLLRDVQVWAPPSPAAGATYVSFGTPE